MRSLKSSLLTLTIAGTLGMVAVFGCSAEGASDIIGDQQATEPTDEENGNTLPESNPGTSSSGGSSGTTSKDAGKDATKTDAAKDSGPPPPAPGDACTVADKTYKKSCGKCGSQEAICLDMGGSLKVSDYSACTGETGVCVPGETVNEACGNCGTLTKTCNNYCAWSSSTCGGQPTNSCSPGAIEYSTAGCSTANTYRNRTCATACTWGTFSTTCAEPNNPIKLTLPTTVNGTATPTYTLAATKMGKKHPSYTCGSSASLSSTSDYPYELIELVNPSASQLTIKVKGTSTTFDVAYAVYPTNLPPTTDAELKACSKADYTPYEVTGIVIPPNAKYLLRIASTYNAANTWSEPYTGSVPMLITTTAVQ